MDNSNEGPASKRLKSHRDLQEPFALRPRHSKPRTGWNSLPAELRLEIYCYLIPRFEHPINVSFPKFENRFFREYNDSIIDSLSEAEEAERWRRILPWTKILLINQQISCECLDILYGKNSFQVEMHKTGEADLRANFTRENRQRMRYITVSFLGTEGATFPPGNSIPDYDLWVDTLPDLKELWLVLIQPFKPPSPDESRLRDDWAAWKFRGRLEQYLAWLPPYFELFRDLLPYGTGINMMSNNQPETKEIALQYLTSRSRAFIDHTESDIEEDDGIAGS